MTKKSKTKEKYQDGCIPWKVMFNINPEKETDIPNVKCFGIQTQIILENDNTQITQGIIENITLQKDVEAGSIKGLDIKNVSIFTGTEAIEYSIELDKQKCKNFHSNLEHLLALSAFRTVIRRDRYDVSFNIDIDLEELILYVNNLNVIKDNDLITKIEKLLKEQKNES